MQGAMMRRSALCGVLIGLTAAAVGAEGSNVMTMTIVLEAPQAAPFSALDTDMQRYDGAPYDVRLTFRNDGSAPMSFPNFAIVRSVARSYRNLDTGAEQVFRQGEPPSPDAELLTLQPGESWSYGLGLEFPGQILPANGRNIPVQLCAVWDKANLDARIYPPGSYDWAESFEACHKIDMQAPPS